MLRNRAVPSESYIATFALLPTSERLARLRALQCLVHVLAGPQHPSLDLLAMAESNPKHLDRAAQLFDEIPSLRRRQILSVFGLYLPKRRNAA